MTDIIPGLVLWGFLAMVYVLVDIVCIRFVEDNLWRHLPSNALIKILLYAFAPLFAIFHILLLLVLAIAARIKLLGGNR